LWKEAKMFRTSVQANIHQFRNTELSEAELEEMLLEMTLPKQSWE
jgi:hypothetical protein